VTRRDLGGPAVLRSVEADTEAAAERLDAQHLRKSELRANLARLRAVRGD
jgi:hypothetical protein